MNASEFVNRLLDELIENGAVRIGKICISWNDDDIVTMNWPGGSLTLGECPSDQTLYEAIARAAWWEGVIPLLPWSY